MGNIIFGIYIFLQILIIFIFLDIVLSWLMLFGIKFRPEFLSDIVDPIYTFVKKYIPTTFGPFEFAPMIVIFILSLLQYLIMIL